MKFKCPLSLVNTRVRVLLVGAGGTGAYCGSLLAQCNYLLRALSDDMAYLEVTVVDPDVVTEFNIGRQGFYPCDIGKPKSKVLVDRLNLGFGTHWRYAVETLESCRSPHLYDVLFTCVDNIKCRQHLGQQYQNVVCETLWIDGGNGRSDGQVIMGHLGVPKAEEKLPNVFDLYQKVMATAREEPGESCSHQQALHRQDFGVNHMTALLMVQQLWLLLRHGELDHHGNFFDLHEGCVIPLAADADIWRTFGYRVHEFTGISN